MLQDLAKKLINVFHAALKFPAMDIIEGARVVPFLLVVINFKSAVWR